MQQLVAKADLKVKGAQFSLEREQKSLLGIKTKLANAREELENRKPFDDEQENRLDERGQRDQVIELEKSIFPVDKRIENYEAALSRARREREESLLEAQANVDSVKVNLAQVKADFFEKESAVELASKEILNAERVVELTQQILDDLQSIELRAPFDGKISDLIAVGRGVPEGSVICKLTKVSEATAIDRAVSATFKLRLLDSSNKPIEGVQVALNGARVVESPGSWIGWPDGSLDKDLFQTDKNGEFEVELPTAIELYGVPQTVTKFCFHCQHPFFELAQLEFDSKIGFAEHVLTQACQAEFTGEIRNDPIQEFAVLMAGQASEALWNLDEGVSRSKGIPKGQWQTMLVAMGTDGLHQFSDVFPAIFERDRTTQTGPVKLQPGMRIRGALSANVPRPIVNGSVIVWCTPKPAGEYYSSEPTLGWSDEAVIAPDGRFEFPSLPRGGNVQFMALCDGWLVDGVEGSSIVGKVVDIDEASRQKNLLDNIVIDMVPAGQVEVAVIGPDGKSLAGASVTTWPNQRLQHHGATLLGHCLPSINFVESQISGSPPPRADFSKNVRYSQKTDAAGKATLKVIPIGFKQTLHVEHPGMTMREGFTAGAIRSIPYECLASEPIRLEVNMQSTNAPSQFSSTLTDAEIRLDP